MPKWVDIEKIEKKLLEEHPNGYYNEELGEAVRDAPGEDVAPVVHGKWIEAWIKGVCHYKCSDCSEYTEEVWHANFVYNYCPNCGAKMDL